MSTRDGCAQDRERESLSVCTPTTAVHTKQGALSHAEASGDIDCSVLLL